MTTILGISAFYHDSAAALVRDGEIVAAAQEERFTRKKHDASFPTNAIDYCLKAAALEPGQVDYVCFYEKPLRKFERLLETYLAFAPSGFRSFRMALPLWLKERVWMSGEIRRALGSKLKSPLIFTDHHESHAASAFFPSPFDEAAILTLDGVGEWSTTTFGFGSGNKITLAQHLQFPHSLGLLYSAFTYYCGFRVNSGEYKLMGLAPYGRPAYRDLITEHLIDIKPDGSFWLDTDYFNYCQGLTMTNDRFHRLFGGPPRRPEATIEQRHMDLAASIQAVTEDIFLRMGRHIFEQTGSRKLVLAGGVALNCVANGRLLREGPFDSIWIQPAAGDAGGALGAALFVWHQLLDKPRQADPHDSQKGSLLGPRSTVPDVEHFLRDEEARYAKFDSEPELLAHVCELLTAGKIVGWFSGPMEFGPRALGARSILGDPRSREMQSVMNVRIKFRESFRPFAPCVLAEEASKWFDLEPGQESPYMLLVAPVHESRRLPASPEELRIMAEAPDLRERLRMPRSTVPAVTHVDYSARVQTVDERRHGRFYRLLKTFYRETGCPVLVNTSFNVRGEPIVGSAADAYRCFLATDMDALVIEDLLLVKTETAPGMADSDREKYLQQFQLD
jgi:carbamoyltransferase